MSTNKGFIFLHAVIDRAYTGSVNNFLLICCPLEVISLLYIDRCD